MFPVFCTRLIALFTFRRKHHLCVTSHLQHAPTFLQLQPSTTISSLSIYKSIKKLHFDPVICVATYLYY